MEIGELLVNLGFKADYGKLRDFIHDLGDLNVAALIGGGALGLMVDQVKHLLDSANQTASALNNFTALTGQSQQELQAWDKVAQESGISAGVLASTINTLQNNIQGLELTGEGAAAYGRLGIDPRQYKDYFSLLSAISDKIKDMPISLQKWYLQQLGISEQFVQMLPHLNEISQQTTNTADELQNMREYQHESVGLMLDFKTLMVSIASIIEKSFVGDMLRGLDIIVKLLDHWEVLVPLLGIAAFLTGQIAAASIIAGLANPVTAPAAIGALAVGATLAGASVLGALARGGDDNSRNIQQENNITVNGTDSDKIGRTIADHIEKMHSDAEYQSPSPGY